MSNSVACRFDNSGSKCKKMYRFKISASAGMTNAKPSPLNLALMHRGLHHESDGERCGEMKAGNKLDCLTDL